MKNNFFAGLVMGVITMSLVGFTAVQTTNVFAPAAPAIVTAKMCNTQLEIIQAMKFFGDRKYIIDVYQLSSGTVVVLGRKY